MKLSYIFLGVLLAVIGIVANAGFRGDKSAQPPLEIFPDMNYQDKVKDQQPSAFFDDGNSARAPIAGTVAEEMPAVSDYWATGKWDDAHWGNGIPTHDGVDGGRALQIDDTNMARGRERYTISCAPCHGDAGDGKGITSKYGLNGAASYHDDRLRKEPDGQLFDTISNGHGQMLGYAYNVSIDDRWRIVMYLRALQRSQNAQLADASPEEQTQLDKTKKPPAPAPAAAPDSGGSTNAAPSAPQGGTPPASNAPAATPPSTTLNEPKSGKFQFDVGYEFSSSPPDPMSALKYTLRFDLSANEHPDLRLDYGKSIASSDCAAKSPVEYLSQAAMSGWYEGDLENQF